MDSQHMPVACSDWTYFCFFHDSPFTMRSNKTGVQNSPCLSASSKYVGSVEAWKVEEPDDDVTIAKLHDTVGSVWVWSKMALGDPVGILGCSWNKLMGISIVLIPIVGIYPLVN